MSDIRRSILWAIFGFSLVMLWDQWQIHNGHTPTFFGAPAQSKAAQAASDTPTATVGAGAVPEAAAPVAASVLTTVTSDVLDLTFDSQGGALVGAKMLKHAEVTGLPKTADFVPMVLLQQNANRTYVAQSGLIGGDFPTHKTAMKLVTGGEGFKDGQDRLDVTFESDAQGGLVLSKTYSLNRNSYAISVKQSVRNVGSAPVSPKAYVQLVRDSNTTEGTTPFYSTFTGPAFYTNEQKFEKVTFEDIDKNKLGFVKQANDGYVAMVQHYFASAWWLGDNVAHENFARKVGNVYAAGMITDLGEIAPGATKELSAHLFVGPQDEKVLEALTPGLELVKDYGWVTILAKPLYWLLEKIHGLLGNWGWSIIGLVVLIKAAFYWLNASAYRSMAKMKAINPRIMDMRERLKDNPQQMQMEMMKMYKEEKVNPLGGCFPIMIQIPVFIALYWVLLASVEMRNAPWLGWIVDLSTKDPYYILPVIMTLTTVFQTALNPLPPDPMQAKMMWLMPLFFSVMFFFFPAGLVLYWITNNTLTIAQQAFINHRMGVPVKFNIPSFK